MSVGNGQEPLQLQEILLVCFPAPFFLLVIARVIWIFARTVTVSLSTTGFEIEEKALFHRQRTEIAYNKLEQIIAHKIPPFPLLYLSEGSITLVNDTTDIRIGKGLDEGSSAYLYAILIRAAAGKEI